MNRKLLDAAITSASVLSFRFDSPATSERPSMKLQKTLLSVVLAFAAASPAMAVTTVTLDFNNLADFAPVVPGYGNPNSAVAFTWASGDFLGYTPGANPASDAAIFGPSIGPGSVMMVGQAGQSITQIKFDYFIFSDSTPDTPTGGFRVLTWAVTDGTNSAGGTLNALSNAGPPTYPVQGFEFNVPFAWNGTSLTMTLENPGQFIGYDNLTVTAVPEPGTYAMLLAGLAAVGFLAKRRRQPA